MGLAICFVTTLLNATDSVGGRNKPPVETIVVRATGVGHPPAKMTGPRARLMAQRAAEVVAVRNLARKIDPTGRTPVGSFRYVAVRSLAGGSVEVTVEARTVKRSTRP